MNKKQNIIKVIQLTLCVILICAIFYSLYNNMKKTDADKITVTPGQTTETYSGTKSYIIRDANGDPVGIIFDNADDEQE